MTFISRPKKTKVMEYFGHSAHSLTTAVAKPVEAKHSAWPESNAACPRPRDGRRGGKKLALGAFATVERRVPWAEPTFGLCFRAKALKETNGEARRAEPTSPFS